VRMPRPEDVRRAAERLRGQVVRTPVLESPWLSAETGGRIYLKVESLQRTGAFKFRGALNALGALDAADRRQGVLTASSGNHGLGLALAGRLLGVKVTVVVPHRAPEIKVERLERLGAEVRRHGEVYDEACAFAAELAQRDGRGFIPSFDHPDIVAGQGTVGTELLEDVPGAELWICPVGGGGLLSGLALAAGSEGPRVVGVQVRGADAMRASLAAGRRVRNARVDTLADGIAVAMPGELTFAICADRSLSVVTVEDSDLVYAAGGLLVEERLVVEAAGAAGVAALRAGAIAASGRKAVVVITGGNAPPAFIARALEAWCGRAGNTSPAEK